MALTKDQVRHVARLARLSLSDEEVEKYASQLSDILGYMEILNELDTSNVEPTAQVTGLLNVSRDDEVRPYISRNELLKCTELPLQDNQIKVRSVFE